MRSGRRSQTRQPQTREKGGVKMTEYHLCGLVFFAFIAITLLLYFAYYCINKAIRKRKIKQLKREYRRRKQTQTYAEFVAVSEAF